MITPQSIVKASAGSGKTHHLSGHILALLCIGECPSKIFASTFTRKAAGEMFERVVKRLLQATESEINRARFLKEISLPENLLEQDQILKVLATLIKEQSRSRISTLDSFFVSIGQAFFTELILPGSWKIADPWELSRLEETALEQTISSLGKDTLKSLLILLSNRKNSSFIRSSLLAQMKTIYEEFRSSSPEVWGAILDASYQHTRLDPLHIRSLMEVEHPVEVDGVKVNKNTFNKAKELLRFFEEERWEDILSSGLTESVCLSKTCLYYSKPIPPQIIEGISLLYKHARSEFLKTQKEKTIALAAIASEYNKQIVSASIQNGLISFRELTHILSASIDTIELQDIYYRLDNNISHLLIDEFQDTSPLQWNILEPLASEILSKIDSEHSFLIVGDIKQAIYAWRGGTSELFEVLTTRYPQLKPYETTLTTTYRSYTGVVACINSVFSRIAQNPALTDQQDAAQKWSKDFHEHSAFKKGTFGKILIKSISLPQRNQEKYSKQEITEKIQEELLKDIIPFTENQSVKSIGILTRTNAQASTLERFFYQNGYQVSGEGGEPLSHSKTLQLIISVLTLANHPKDSLSYHHIMESPLRSFIHDIPGGVSKEDSPAYISDILFKLYTSTGLEAFLREIIHTLTPYISSSDYDRCLYLLTLALGFERKGGRDLDDFVNILKHTSIETASSSKIKIMTFHKSKGLEFDVVFIPFTDDAFYSARSISLLKKQTNPLQEPELVFTNCNQKLRRHYPELNEMFDAATSTMTVEGLSMTYVALSRAVHSLFVYLPPHEPSENSRERTIAAPSMASILRGAFGYFDSLPPGTILYQHDAPLPEEPLGESSNREFIHDTQEYPLQNLSYKAPDYSINKNLHRRYPSERDSTPIQRIRESLDKNARRGSTFGTKIHAILKEISWIDKKFDELDISLEKTEREYLLSAFSHTTIQKIFNHKTFAENPDDITLERELAFSLIDSTEMLSGRLDRLVVIKKENKPLSAIIIDFKTGLHADKTLIASQDIAYKKFVSGKYSLRSEQIKTQFVFLSTGEILEY